MRGVGAVSSAWTEQVTDVERLLQLRHGPSTTTERLAKPRSSHVTVTFRSVCRTGLLSPPCTPAPKRPAGARRRPRALHRQLAPDRNREGRAPWQGLHGGRSRSAVTAMGPVRVRERPLEDLAGSLSSTARTVRLGELYARLGALDGPQISPCKGCAARVRGGSGQGGREVALFSRTAARREPVVARPCLNPVPALHWPHEHTFLETGPRRRPRRGARHGAQDPAGVRGDVVRRLQRARE